MMGVCFSCKENDPMLVEKFTQGVEKTTPKQHRRENQKEKEKKQQPMVTASTTMLDGGQTKSVPMDVTGVTVSVSQLIKDQSASATATATAPSHEKEPMKTRQDYLDHFARATIELSVNTPDGCISPPTPISRELLSHIIAESLDIIFCKKEAKVVRTTYHALFFMV
jgi:hypothetical protein